MNKIHGHCGKHWKSPTYRSWSDMRDRCRNPKHRAFHNYGGRGITVCHRWDLFENFLADMGEQPAGMTIERKDSNGNYDPENCKWIPLCEQSKNLRTSKRWTINGITYLSCRDAEAATGISNGTIRRMVKRGVPGFTAVAAYDGGMG